ncbi:hypothetical protein LMG24238_07170 [Paraburkholderia sediminicola]|uniref:RelA/SpoT domain-containing protein n=1 Tax=Paraburkholderia sediminicola TaxID=458836 RepID=A0A6J5CRP9_9BURK|nr:RelA/SpoT domain-containing protein [Paraburkholderia sediminicola]CAB3743931.1 hypothetical protein LMG24238_07170 [Paraburkholderia sediminicola]
MNFEEYERDGQHVYAQMSTTVAAILTAAINAERDQYRMQLVKARAKQPVSLRRKLQQQRLAETTTLETEIKDLAGCRVIFYTNSDVTRFINSGIIQQNFEVLDVKIHHPRRDLEDATELYTSNHYIVALNPERIAFPEYADFAGMRCEIQIQTILNHAWAEMAHDTIYKAPELANFGGKAFDGIKARMKKVAQKYLVPAGYEFQKIASDFQRLVDGKALFDGDALEAIVTATDNNARLDAIEKLADNVLPFYDDLQAIYPDVVPRLLAAVEHARATPEKQIETPDGMLPATTSSDIVFAATDILKHYRYLDVDSTFDALCKLYGQAANSGEVKKLLELGKELSRHQLEVWQQYGSVVQEMLLVRIEALSGEQRIALHSLLTPMLTEILGTEIRGTTASSSAVTFHTGSVVASDRLRAIRTKAIELLKQQFRLARTDEERHSVLQALESGTRLPYQSVYSNELQRMVMDDMRTVIEFQTEVADSLSLELLRQAEVWIHRCYWNHVELPAALRDVPELAAARADLVAATIAFRDTANATTDFVIYKTLVGYDSVLQPAWHDEAFRYTQPAEYRTEQIDGFVAEVDETTAETWFDRIKRYARTESDDLATFPEFGKFLERLGETKPAIVLGYIARTEGPLARFLPAMLTGLTRSTERATAFSQIDTWLNAGEHLRRITWYLQFADPFDETVLKRALDSAIQHGDQIAVRNALVAAERQFADHPGTLVDAVFLPALRYLETCGDFSWLHLPLQTWYRSPIIGALDKAQAVTVLDTLVRYPRLESSVENVIATIAEKWPESVVTFLGVRQTLARLGDVPPNYDAVPFAVHELNSPLAAVPDVVLEGARAWFNDDPLVFTYDGGRLLASLFPDLAGGLNERLERLIDGGNERDLAFVLSVLRAFSGRTCIYDLTRKIVATLNAGNPLLEQVQLALRETGVVHGEYGFADLYAERKALLGPWLTDPSERVREFAEEQMRLLDQLIAAEHRSVETRSALRKLQYGEELDGRAGDE